MADVPHPHIVAPACSRPEPPVVEGAAEPRWGPGAGERGVHSPNETRSDPPCCRFIAQLLERRSDQEEPTVTLSTQILTETRSQVDRAPMASASAQDRVSFASGLARSERGERWTRRLFKRMGIFYMCHIGEIVGDTLCSLTKRTGDTLVRPVPILTERPSSTSSSTALNPAMADIPLSTKEL